MTYSMPLKDAPPRPDYGWTLWSRADDRPDHWELEARHRIGRCEELQQVITDRETVILPPGVMPCG